MLGLHKCYHCGGLIYPGQSSGRVFQYMFRFGWAYYHQECEEKWQDEWHKDDPAWESLHPKKGLGHP